MFEKITVLVTVVVIALVATSSLARGQASAINATIARDRLDTVAIDDFANAIEPLLPMTGSVPPAVISPGNSSSG